MFKHRKELTDVLGVPCPPMMPESLQVNLTLSKHELLLHKTHGPEVALVGAVRLVCELQPNALVEVLANCASNFGSSGCPRGLVNLLHAM